MNARRRASRLLSFSSPSWRLALVRMAAVAPLLVGVLGACSSAPDDAETSQDETAALSNCLKNPLACPPVDPCVAACESVTTCSTVRSGSRTCACAGSCASGFACSSGQCAPTCTAPKPTYREWWVPGAHNVRFQQMPPGQSPNPDTKCYSGCGPTAWAMFFAQIDSHWGVLARTWQAPQWNVDPTWFATLTDASGTVWPTANTNQITMDISHHLGTSCSAPFGNGAYTEPTWMASVGDYIKQGPEAQYSPHGPMGGYESSAYTYTYDTHNTDDSLAIDSSNLYGTLDYARDWIINHGYPVVYGYNVNGSIGAAHYGLATGYREKVQAASCTNVNGSMQWVVTKSDPNDWQFYINGGGGDTDDWRRQSAYYVGTIKIDKK